MSSRVAACLFLLALGGCLPNRESDSPIESTPITPASSTDVAPAGAVADDGEVKTAEAVADVKQEDVLVVIKTERGDINLIVYASKVPVTAASFLNLAKRGYFDGLIFHRVLDNFMIQGGDPKGTGTGGPGYNFRDETTRELTHDRAGILSMANSDRFKRAYSNTGKSNGSQFFITHKATPHLDGLHTVFGAVIEAKDQDIVNAIREDDKIKTIEILDEEAAAVLFKSRKADIAGWNKVLDK